MPKVSVIIPAYNAMKYLPETLESVLKQTFTDFEVVIVDDGSSDNISEWANQIIDDRVRLISQQNQELAAARNTGILNSTGEYIAFIDADDIWEASKLEKQVNYLDSHPLVGLVDTWTALIDENGNFLNKIINNSIEGDVRRTVTEVCNAFIASGSSPMIRRTCFDKVGLFDVDIKFAEDVDMWIRIGIHYHFGVVKEPLIRYRQHSNSKSRNCQSMLEGIRKVIEKTYSSMPTELLHLRGKSYGTWYLYFAWTALKNHNYPQAIEFRNQAIAHYPQQIFSIDFWRLSIAIALQTLLGVKGYEGVKYLMRMLRQPLSRMS
ncbi:glycosyl transferase family A [Brunnivagina elsteri CCALA 953]|uniref:Glycosyl transferase family A n=2 Tax=Brunnivagina TaxID=3344733 RepID=A0A2A2TBL4_9CYAN|nr:glycosyltransferase [Calothrix elsteri]PAX51026.1 glycosyl transferase family A [Calothrix elsteri CCALA 953]